MLVLYEGYGGEAYPDHLVQHEAGARHLHQRDPLRPAGSSQVTTKKSVNFRYRIGPLRLVVL